MPDTNDPTNVTPLRTGGLPVSALGRTAITYLPAEYGAIVGMHADGTQLYVATSLGGLFRLEGNRLRAVPFDPPPTPFPTLPGDAA